MVLDVLTAYPGSSEAENIYPERLQAMARIRR